MGWFTILGRVVEFVEEEDLGSRMAEFVFEWARVVNNNRCLVPVLV